MCIFTPAYPSLSIEYPWTYNHFCQIDGKFLIDTISETMDAIRKKMQSLKGETDGLYATIRGFEDAAKEATARADQVGTGTTAVFLNCFHYKKKI